MCNIFLILCGVDAVCWLLETKVGKSHSIAVDLDNVAHFGHIDKLVDQSLTVDFGKNSSLVIVSVDKGENLLLNNRFAKPVQAMTN